MNITYTRPGELRKPDIEVLPDGRIRIVRYVAAGHGSRDQGEIDESIGSPDDGLSTALLVKRAMGLEQGKAAIIKTYEVRNSASETQVGLPDVTFADNGLKTIVQDFVQMSSGAYVPGIVGSTQSLIDATCILQQEQAEDDGTTRQIRRVYINKGLINQSDEIKNNGALLIKTLVFINDVPSPNPPTGYTLVSTQVSSPNGLETTTFTFAKGDGEISRTVDFSQSSDQGVTGVTRTVIRYLTANSVTTDPTSLGGSVKITSDFQDQDGYRIWTATYAKGAGTVIDDIDYSNQGALARYRRVSLGSVPVSPTGVAGGLTRVSVTSGGSGYTSVPTVSISGGGGSGATAVALVAGLQVISLTITAGGSGYTSTPTVIITGGGGSGATAIAVLSTATVSSLSLTAGGSGYISVPTVALTGGGGTGATASVSLTATSLSTITLTNSGSGYTSAPTVAITGGGGSGATASATVIGGTVTSITLTSGGSGYSSAPTLSFTGGGGTGATGTASLATAAVSSVTLTASGSGYTSAPTVTFSGGSGTGATATAVLPATTVASTTVTGSGVGYKTTPTAVFSGGGGSGAAAVVNMISGVGGLQLTSGGSGYASSFAVQIVGGGGTGATAEAYVVGGVVIGVQLIQAGSGYTSLPTVDFSSGSGSGAAAVALPLGGVTRIISGNLGTGYTSVPTVTITGGGGSGATAVASFVASGAVYGLILTNSGSGYTSTPNVTITGGGGTGATAGIVFVVEGTVSSLTLSSGGSGYTSAPSLAITGGSPTSAATATTALTARSVSSLTLTSGGSGYTFAPSVTLTGGGGSGATASSEIATVAVASLTLTSGGFGYTTAPTLSLVGGGGSGATGTASTTGVTVNGITLTSAGSGYTSTPTVTLSGGGGSGATGAANLVATSIGVINLTNAGSGYTTAPVIAFSGGGGTGATATAVLSTKTVASLSITAGGSGYTSVPTVAFSGGGGTGTTATATVSTASVVSVLLTAPGSGYTSPPAISFTGGGGSGAAAFSPGGSVAVLISIKTRKDSGFDVYDYTWAAGLGRISENVDVKNNGALTLTTVRYFFTDDGAAPAGTVISTDTVFQDGVTITTKVYAQGTGEISRTIDYSQSSDQGTTGITRTTIRHLVVPGGTIQPTTLAGSVAIGQDVSEQDGYRVWTTTWAKGTGTVSTAVSYGNQGKLRIYRVTSLGVAPSTPSSTISGTVVLIDTAVRQSDGFVIYDYSYAEGRGVISVREQQRAGGLRLVTWVSLGQGYDSSYMLPPGVLMANDRDDRDGHAIWTVTTMQLASGGADPTSGTAHTFTTNYPFRFPGRAKAVGVTVVVDGVTKTCYDVYKSPPVDILVTATVTVTYQTSNLLGSLTNALWNPTAWATVFAKFGTWNAYPKAIVDTLLGYRSVSETPITFNGGNGLTETCFGERVYGMITGSPYSLAVYGGPAAPDGNTYSLAAEIDPEPAFTSADGTKYYRKNVTSATIPTQDALPI
jgi:hypothetical protein